MNLNRFSVDSLVLSSKGGGNFMRLPKSSCLPLGLTWRILSLPHFQQCGAIDQVLNGRTPLPSLVINLLNYLSHSFFSIWLLDDKTQSNLGVSHCWHSTCQSRFQNDWMKNTTLLGLCCTMTYVRSRGCFLQQLK